MIAPWRSADAVLRGRSLGRPWGLIVACGLVYGGVMGSFGGLEGDRPWQVAYAAAKVPLLLLATLALSLPSYFVLNTLLGLRADFAEALRGVIASQAALAVILVALAPLVLFWYASTDAYQPSILFNAAMFAVASLGGQVVLRRAYRPLIARSDRHRILLRAWVAIYAFVGIQLGWTLRPFLGAPNEPSRFFRGGDWESAYVIVARMIWRVIAGP
jgi:hypothetical protein